jgi:hypothetical protein
MKSGGQISQSPVVKWYREVNCEVVGMCVCVCVCPIYGLCVRHVFRWLFAFGPLSSLLSVRELLTHAKWRAGQLLRAYMS